MPTLQELGIRLPLYPTLPSLQGLPFGIGDNLEGSFVRDGSEFGNKTSWMKGKHSIQFGGEIQFYAVDIVNEYRRGGNYSFGTTGTGMAIADIMLGDMTRFEQGTGEYKNNRARYYSMFAQDDYKISQRVSLNLGVRWEPAPPWREQVGRFQQFRLEDYQNNVRSTLFDNAPPGLLFRGDPGVPYDGTNIDWMNIGTRVGVGVRLDRRRQDQHPRRLGHVLRPAARWGVLQRRRELAAVEHHDQHHRAAGSVLRSVSRTNGRRVQCGDSGGHRAA